MESNMMTPQISRRLFSIAAKFVLLSGISAVAPVIAAQSDTAVAVSVAPQSASLAANGSVQFKASVSGSTNQGVTWMVNGVPGGAPSIGTISTAGLYVAPAGIAAPISVSVEAEAAAAPLANGTAAVGVKASTLSGPTYYVATTGNDANSGSAAAPWRTIQHAVSTVPAGGTVVVNAGVYNEAVTITRSGNATAGYITVEAAPGVTATVDGTGLAVGNGGQQGLFTLYNANYVRVIGFEIRNFSTNSASDVPAGIFVYGSGDHIEIRKNHIHNIVTTVQTSAGDAFGMAVYGSATAPISNLIVDGNELDHLVTGFSESMTINGNVVNWQVTNNKVHDNNNIGIDAIGFEQTAPTVALDQARNGWIADNSVYNITSAKNPSYNDQPSADGIYVDGGTQITIERNMVLRADIGIELASEHQTRNTSYVTARNNLVVFSNVVGGSIGGYASNVGGTTHCNIVNNTFYENDTLRSGSGEFQIQYNASANVFENNILYASAQGVLVNSFVASTTSPAALDYDIYDTSSGVSAAQWIWNNATFTSFASFKTASVGEAHGLLVSPLFTSATASDVNLHLATGSPGINSGINLGLAIEGLYDYDGNARTAGGLIDRGAYAR
jgi:hypothetical protein